PIWKIDRAGDPFPALLADTRRLRLELFLRQAVEERGVLQPAFILEEVARDRAACRLVGLHSDEPRAAIVGIDGALGQVAADDPGRLIMALLNRSPDLLLARVIVGHGEGHELLERHLLRGVLFEQGWRDRSEL